MVGHSLWLCFIVSEKRSLGVFMAMLTPPFSGVFEKYNYLFSVLSKMIPFKIILPLRLFNGL